MATISAYSETFVVASLYMRLTFSIEPKQRSFINSSKRITYYFSVDVDVQAILPLFEAIEVKSGREVCIKSPGRE